MNLNPNWLAAPIVIPLFMAALGLALAPLGQRQTVRAQQFLALVTTIVNLGIAIWLLYYTIVIGERLVLQMGGWAAPFGIAVVADGLSAILLTLAAILALATVLYAMGTLDERRNMHFYPLILFLLMGVNGAFLAGDLFNLYVFFEVLLMSSFVLLTLGGQSGQISGGIRYVVLNLMASLVFLSAAGIAYGTLGTLNFAHLAQRMEQAPPGIQALLAGMLLIAYSSKAGLFPLYFWLPSSYHTPHPAVTAFFGGLLTKVGIYTLLFPTYLVDWQPLILAIAGLTMLTGVFGAMAVNTMRRVLSFHVISQVGYMVMGLGLAGSADPVAAGFGLAAGILYLVHHMIVKTALLMAGGAAEMEMGSGNLLANQLKGLSTRRPLLAIIFFFAAFSLAGIPPSSGFVSKLGLLQSALSNQHWLIATVSLLVSVFTLMSMVRLWQYAFAGAATQPPVPTAPLARPGKRWLTLTPIAGLVLLSLAIGIFSAPVFQWSTVAAQQALDRAGYIAAVQPTDEIIMLEKK
jgi:multicomponent Na+:H+ antiporter subunit D